MNSGGPDEQRARTAKDELWGKRPDFLPHFFPLGRPTSIPLWLSFSSQNLPETRAVDASCDFMHLIAPETVRS